VQDNNFVSCFTPLVLEGGNFPARSYKLSKIPQPVNVIKLLFTLIQILKIRNLFLFNVEPRQIISETIFEPMKSKKRKAAANIWRN